MGDTTLASVRLMPMPMLMLTTDTPDMADTDTVTIWDTADTDTVSDTPDTDMDTVSAITDTGTDTTDRCSEFGIASDAKFIQRRTFFLVFCAARKISVPPKSNYEKLYCLYT